MAEAQQEAQQVKLFVNCPNCNTQQKVKVKNCKKCGWDLNAPPAWMPTWKWHLKTLGIIYAILIVAYFVIDAWLTRLPPPFDIRDIPPEVTPWLK